MRLGTYYCSKCGRNHHWDSEIGSRHAKHEFPLFELEIGDILLRESLKTHSYNPKSVEYIYQVWILENDNYMRLGGYLKRKWLFWDGKDVGNAPTNQLGYPVMQPRMSYTDKIPTTEEWSKEQQAGLKKIQETLKNFVGGIRQQSFRRLVSLALILYSIERPKEESWHSWFASELTVQNVQNVLGCSERTAWDYLKTLRKLASILP